MMAFVVGLLMAGGAMAVTTVVPQKLKFSPVPTGGNILSAASNLFADTLKIGQPANAVKDSLARPDTAGTWAFAVHSITWKFRDDSADQEDLPSTTKFITGGSYSATVGLLSKDSAGFATYTTNAKAAEFYTGATFVRNVRAPERAGSDSLYIRITFDNVPGPPAGLKNIWSVPLEFARLPYLEETPGTVGVTTVAPTWPKNADSVGVFEIKSVTWKNATNAPIGSSVRFRDAAGGLEDSIWATIKLESKTVNGNVWSFDSIKNYWGTSALRNAFYPKTDLHGALVDGARFDSSDATGKTIAFNIKFKPFARPPSLNTAVAFVTKDSVYTGDSTWVIGKVDSLIFNGEKRAWGSIGDSVFVAASDSLKGTRNAGSYSFKVTAIQPRFVGDNTATLRVNPLRFSNSSFGVKNWRLKADSLGYRVGSKNDSVASIDVSLGTSWPRYRRTAIEFDSIVLARDVNKTFTTKNNDSILVKGRDFDVAYKNNVNVFRRTSALTAEDSLASPQVKITFKGNYTGDSTVYFQIDSAAAPVITQKSPGKPLAVNWAPRIDVRGLVDDLYQIKNPTGADFSYVFAWDSSGSSRTNGGTSAIGDNNIVLDSLTGLLSMRRNASEPTDSNGGVFKVLMWTKGKNIATPTAVACSVLVANAKAPSVSFVKQPSNKTVVLFKLRDSLVVETKLAVQKDSVAKLYQWYVKAPADTAYDSIKVERGGNLAALVLEKQLLIEVGTYKFKCEAWAEDSTNGTRIVGSPKVSNEVTVTVIPNTLESSVGALDFADRVTTDFSFSQSEFVLKLPTNPVKIYAESKGGKAADWKIVKLTYKSNSPGYEDVVNSGESVPAAHAGVPSAWGTGEYNVEIVAENTNINSVGYGLRGSKTIVFAVLGRSISNAAITVMPATTVYSGEIKSPSLLVTDGTNNVLTEGVDYTVAAPAEGNWTYAGTANVKIEGTGNYSGSKTATFTITKKALTLDKDAEYTFERKYNGSDKIVPEEGFEIKFIGVAGTDVLKYGEDYTVNNFKFNSKDVGDSKTVSGTVVLLDKGAASKNYSLSSGDGAFKSTGKILKGEATESDFKDLGLPKSVLYTGKTQTPGTVAWASGVDNKAVTGDKEKDGKFAVLYNGEADLPLEPGSYTVSVSVNEGASFLKSEVTLGEFKILEAYVPEVSVTPADTAVRETFPVVLQASSFVLDSAGNRITKGITYQWYSVAGEGAAAAKVSGGTSDGKLTQTNLKEGSYTFYVEATYKNSNQATTVKESNRANVTVLPAPKSIEAAAVTVNGDYTYTGKAQIVQDYDVTVVLDGLQLASGSDYTIESKSIAAGSGVITVNAVVGSAYKGSVSKTYVINKKQLLREDITYKPSNTYNGKAQPAVVTFTGGLSDPKAVITVLYDSSATAPTNAGEWTLTVDISDGTNLLGVQGLELGTYSILQVVPNVSMFNFTAPKSVAWDGTPKGVGPVTLKDPSIAAGLGELTVLYNGVEAEPVDSGIEYVVQLVVEGGVNYTPAVIELGKFTIHHEGWVSVASIDREVPKAGGAETAAVAPVAKVKAEVTVGPSPVGANGDVFVFWNGGKAVKGKLVVFSSTGSKVAKLDVSGKGKIGSWNTKGAAEGTYLVKGIVKTSDGEKVKVSALVSVAK